MSLIINSALEERYVLCWRPETAVSSGQATVNLQREGPPLGWDAWGFHVWTPFSPEPPPGQEPEVDPSQTVLPSGSLLEHSHTLPTHDPWMVAGILWLCPPR